MTLVLETSARHAMPSQGHRSVISAPPQPRSPKTASPLFTSASPDFLPGARRHAPTGPSSGSTRTTSRPSDFSPPPALKLPKGWVGFDLETGSAEHLHRWQEPESYFVRCGWIDSTGTHTTTDVNELLDVLYSATLIFGHNIHSFDIPALAVHAGADYDRLMAAAWDSMVLARIAEPPAPKTMRPILYSLDAVAQRLGVSGKTDSVTDLADRVLKRLQEEAAVGLEGREATAAKRAIAQRYREVGTFHLIPADDEDLISYLEGDLVASAAVFTGLIKQLGQAGMTDYTRRENRISRLLNAMTFYGWRVNPDGLRIKLKEEAEEAAQAYSELCLLAPGMPAGRKSPLATTDGRNAFEKALYEAGVAEKDIPRSDTGKISTAKDAIGEGAWIRTRQAERRFFNKQTRRYETRVYPQRYRDEGLRAKYPDNELVQILCELASIVSSTSRKYEELARLSDPDTGVFHSQIGRIQVSGRFGMTKASVTNIGKRSEKNLAQRAVFIARNDSEVLVTVDLDQGDMRSVAAHCQDPAYMAMFAPDKDVYLEMAKAVFGVAEVESNPKEFRKKSKVVSLATTYSMGMDSVIATTGVERAVVEKFFAAMDEQFPVKAKWTRKVRKEAESGWINDNGFGRRMRTDPEDAHTQGPALYGQSTTREILMEGLLSLPEDIQKMLVAIVHDEGVFSVPRERAEEVIEVLKEKLTVVWRGVTFSCGVNGPGENWADCYND